MRFPFSFQNCPLVVNGSNNDEVVITTSDLIEEYPGKELLRIAVPIGSYTISGVAVFSMVEYLQPFDNYQILINGGDPFGVQQQQTVWVGPDDVSYPVPETSSGHGGEYGADPEHAHVTSTSGFLSLYLRSYLMTGGSLIFAPGSITIAALRI